MGMSERRALLLVGRSANSSRQRVVAVAKRGPPAMQPSCLFRPRSSPYHRRVEDRTRAAIRERWRPSRPTSPRTRRFGRPERDDSARSAFVARLQPFHEIADHQHHVGDDREPNSWCGGRVARERCRASSPAPARHRDFDIRKITKVGGLAHAVPQPGCGRCATAV
jgi:hypothetical protein